MPRSSFYYQLKRMDKPDKYTRIKEVMMEVYHRHKGRYGYRRITLELRNRGYRINHKVIYRLMDKCGLKSRVRPRKYSSYKGESSKSVPNLLARNFQAGAPNRKWATDVTEFSLFGNKLYLSPIIDLYNGEIISYSIAHRATFDQTMQMIDRAFEKITQVEDLILHSDQGWQYQMNRYRHRLKEKGIKQSMSRKGTPLDNAVIESFFGTLKSELLYLQKFDSLQHFKSELEKYIEYYNKERIKTKLNGLSPVKYRLKSMNKNR